MKTTRKSFSRKSVLVIISIFLAISLTATGFAAWLISNDAGGETTGGVNVSNVTDAILGVSVNTITEKVKFAPKSTDNTGNVRVDEYPAGTEDKDKDIENLDFEVTGKITKFQTLKVMKVTIKCPDEILEAAGYTWNNDANPRVYKYNATKAFIALPDYAMDKDGKALPLPVAKGEQTETKAMEFEYTNTTVFTGTSDAEKNFAFTVEFGWGALFAGYNPGRFLDAQDRATDTIAEDKFTAQVDNLIAVANSNKGIDVTQNYAKTDKASDNYGVIAFAKRDLLGAMYNLVKTEATYTLVIAAEAK